MHWANSAEKNQHGIVKNKMAEQKIIFLLFAMRKNRRNILIEQNENQHVVVKIQKQ